ncbi:anthranilate phosphoribosyltransferase [Sporosarcina ureilytica]|uniref:Anthranilate phosphoribosyltransferase n=1 Tax=Sporosarcina ureilytica TaxID=298596 RepID=A0A1D8JCH9_9BACL|nr:anthranilate phosphoribosyltransferase [Sporosarcina ureilytica]AOV06411.1 anthranilate phosphoribosyltransferase [Sporosarcina ureilytica]
MRKIIEKVAEGFHLSFEEMQEAAHVLFNEQTAASDIRDFLVALSIKGETAQEIAGLATVMRSFAIPLGRAKGSFMDNCGTGGDGANTFNISTTASFVLAGAGAKLAKHGNRKVSSSSGSSDVLEALGVRLDFTTTELRHLLETEGLAFIFAPQVHPKMKRIGVIREEIGQRTIFNLVGPLTNPMPLASQFTGISRADFAMEYASVLAMLGRKRAIVVSGAGGMDEASLAGQNSFVLLDKGDLIPFTMTADDVGLKAAPLSAIRGGDARENAEIVRSVLSGVRGPHFDTVVFNAGIGLFADGRVGTIQEGVKKAIDSIVSGRALKKLEAIVSFSRESRKEGVLA